LQELTNDISKLVNLHSLALKDNNAINRIPESISHLENLKLFELSTNLPLHLPDAFARLRKLEKLAITRCASLRIPENLEVMHLMIW
jgi:Leucine-rich repeat (LRR) protein